MNNSKIVIVGSSNTDMIIQLDKIPVPGETVIGGNFSMAAGGKGANQAVAAARAGGDVTFIASVGKDSFGAQAIEGFSRDKINVEYIKTIDDVASGVALIFVDKNGENSIAVASGANSHLTPEHIIALKSVISQAQILLVQLETPMKTVERVVQIAYDAGVRVILNPAPAQHLNDGLLKMVSVITPNAIETELLTNIKVTNETTAREASEVLLDKGIEYVVITLGARGVFMACRENQKMIPGFEVNVVDSTGAGDVFNGALVAGLNINMPFDEAIRFANAAGALSVTKLGAQPSAPTRDEIQIFLKKRD